MKYFIKSKYFLEAENRQELLEKIIKKEKISIKEVKEKVRKFMFLSQGDERWRKEYLGKSGEKIGKSGCLITSISMFSYWFGTFRDPEWMAKNLKFLKNGYLLWNSINELDELPFRFVWRSDGYNYYKIKEILESKDGFCLVQLNNGAHWACVIGRYIKGRGFKIADPRDGKPCYAKDRGYIVTGHAELCKK